MRGVGAVYRHLCPVKIAHIDPVFAVVDLNIARLAKCRPRGHLSGHVSIVLFDRLAGPEPHVNVLVVLIDELIRQSLTRDDQLSDRQ